MTDTTTRERLTDIIWNYVPGTERRFHDQAAEAVLAKFVVIHRDGLPEVTVDAHGWIECDDESWNGNSYPDSPFFRKTANQYLAVADHLDRQQSKRNARREELRVELAPNALPYDAGLGGPMRRAIDRIIELEEAAK